MSDLTKEKLIQKYNTPVPRYTSYPTVPFWDNQPTQSQWDELVKKSFDHFGEEDGITLYIHFPFCESLCTYCGCNKYITKNHSVEEEYIQSVISEWKRYKALFEKKPKLKGIHLGGGTPTFFSPPSLETLLSEIISDCAIREDKEFSFEGHPNNTTYAHLHILAKLGFDRVSFGIQDFDETVQKAIHRIQPFDIVAEVTNNARYLGFDSVNFDLIYGLPHQNLETLRDTFDRVKSLNPDRIAFYSYAHLPSLFKAQKSFESFLPSQEEKRELYEYGKKLLLEFGYEEIGMDHFALPSDPLCVAHREGKLHRNFMGYTTSPGRIMIGLGATSISDVYYGFAQNEKSHRSYNEKIRNQESTLIRSHSNSQLDILTSNFIRNLICNQEAEIPDTIWSQLPELNLRKLNEMQREGLITVEFGKIRVSELGIAFIRNICFQFDLKMVEKPEVNSSFSKSI